MGCRPELWRSPKSEASGASRPLAHWPGCEAAGRRKALLPWLCSGSKPGIFISGTLHTAARGSRVRGSESWADHVRVSPQAPCTQGLSVPHLCLRQLQEGKL